MNWLLDPLLVQQQRPTMGSHTAQEAHVTTPPLPPAPPGPTEPRGPKAVSHGLGTARQTEAAAPLPRASTQFKSLLTWPCPPLLRHCYARSSGDPGTGPGQRRPPRTGSGREASLRGGQLLNGTADFLCDFFKFFLLIVGFLCLEIKNRLMRAKQQLPNRTLWLRSARLGSEQRRLRLPSEPPPH